MHWEDDARLVVDAIPVHDIIKNMIILWAERCARGEKGCSNTGGHDQDAG